MNNSRMRVQRPVQHSYALCHPHPCFLLQISTLFSHVTSQQNSFPMTYIRYFLLIAMASFGQHLFAQQWQKAQPDSLRLFPGAKTVNISAQDSSMSAPMIAVPQQVLSMPIESIQNQRIDTVRKKNHLEESFLILPRKNDPNQGYGILFLILATILILFLPRHKKKELSLTLGIFMILSGGFQNSFAQNNGTPDILIVGVAGFGSLTGAPVQEQAAVDDLARMFDGTDLNVRTKVFRITEASEIKDYLLNNTGPNTYKIGLGYSTGAVYLAEVLDRMVTSHPGFRLNIFGVVDGAHGGPYDIQGPFSQWYNSKNNTGLIIPGPGRIDNSVYPPKLTMPENIDNVFNIVQRINASEISNVPVVPNGQEPDWAKNLIDSFDELLNGSIDNLNIVVEEIQKMNTLINGADLILDPSTNFLGMTNFTSLPDLISKLTFHMDILPRSVERGYLTKYVRNGIKTDPEAAHIDQMLTALENKVEKGQTSDKLDINLGAILSGLLPDFNFNFDIFGNTIPIGNPPKPQINLNPATYGYGTVTGVILNGNSGYSSSVNVTPTFPSSPGGIDFSDIVIEGFTIDSINGLPTFITRAEETVSGDSINTDSVSSNFKRYFFEALAMSPEHLYVSLDVINNEGRCRLSEVMEKTYMVRVMLDHDILMKSDYLTTALFSLGDPNPTDKGITADWIDIFEASPYFTDYINMGFGRIPYLQGRAVIIGDSVKANAIGDKVYLTEAPLTLDYELEDLGIDKSGFNFTPAQLADMDSMLSQFESLVQYRLDTAAIRFIDFINTSDRYSELRSVYRAIACAKIFKSLDIDFNAYQAFINTDSIPSWLSHPDSFPRQYYNQQAYQKLYEEPFTDLGGQVQFTEIWGGVEMQQITIEDSAGLAQNQSTIFSTLDTTYLQNENDYFLNKGGLGAPVPELYPSLLTVSPKDTTADAITEGSFATIHVSIFNTSYVKAGAFTVSVYDLIFDQDGHSQRYLVDEIVMDSLSAFSSQELTIDRQLSVSGLYGFEILVDSKLDIPEIEESNNSLTTYSKVYDNQPLAVILSPSSTVPVPNINAAFSFIALDAKEGIPGSVRLISDLDGILMDQNDSMNFVVPSLSLGEHNITLRCENDRGIITEDYIQILVIPYDEPLVSITYPINNQVLFAQVPYEFKAETFDFTDSLICEPSQTSWMVDGIAIGDSCLNTYSFPTPGNYELIFRATNSVGNSHEDTTYLTVLDASNNVDSLTALPSADSSLIFLCADSAGCDTMFNISLPYNARIIEGLMSLEGEYVLLESGNVSGGGAYQTSSIQTSYFGDSVNTNRGSYIYHRSTSSLDLDYNNYPYDPIHEKNVFMLGDTPVVATYLHDMYVSVDMAWVITYPDGYVQSFLYTVPAPPSGIYYPVYPLGLFISNTTGNNRQGRFQIDVYSRPSGAPSYTFEQTIDFTYDYLASDNEFLPSDPYLSSQTLATDVQNNSPFSPIQFGLDTLSNTENRIYSYMSLEDVADSLYIQWNWYTPSGDVYKEEVVRVQPPPGTNAWYDWVKAWSYLDVDGTNAGSITGEWTVSAQIRYFYQSGGITLSSFPTVLRDTFVIDGIGNISYPSHPALSIGTEEVWNHFGTFQDSVMINIAGGINGYLAADSSMQDTIKVPIYLHSQSPGQLFSDSLFLRYALLDLRPPVIDSLFSTITDPVISGNNFDFQIVVTDNQAVNAVHLQYDGQTYPLTKISNTDSYQVSNLTAGISGSYPIVIEASDSSGNVSSYSTDLVIENPIASLKPNLSVAPSTWTSSSTFTITWNDLGSAIDAYYLKIGQGDFVSQGSNTTASIFHQTDGISNIFVVGKDVLGNNTAVDTAYLFLDKTPPNKLTVNPLAGITNWQTDTLFLIKWQNPGDVGGGIVDYELSLNDDAPVSIGDTSCYQLSINQSGITEWKARAKDIVNQYGEWSDSLIIKVDLSPPSSSGISSSTHPDQTMWSNNAMPQFELSSYDAHSGIAGHRYLFTGDSTSIPGPTSFFLEEDSLDVSSLPVLTNTQNVAEGLWFLHIRPVDLVGHMGPVSRYRIQVDLTAPESSHSISQDTFFVGDTLRFDILDGLSGVKYLNYSIGDTLDFLPSDGSIVLDTAGTFRIYFFAEDHAGNQEAIDSLDIVSLAGVSVMAKVFLQGAFNQTTGLMDDGLRSQGLIPSMEPYSALVGFSHVLGGGGENIDPSLLMITGPEAIVDWVFLELRNKNDHNQVLATRSALLQRDGDIVEVDGSSAVFFEGIEPDHYFLSVRHRNHLGVMTLTSVPLGD